MIRNIYIILLLSLSFGDVTDIDGNVYETVQIGDQLWMAENLKVTHYNDGSEIQYVQKESSEPNIWENLSTGAYGYYNDDPSNLNTYGNLYNWWVVDDDRGVCPEGFHVPSDEEFMELEMELGMSEEEANSYGYRGTDEGSQLAGNSDLWNDGDLENNSEFGTSGFNALPTGSRDYQNGGYYSMGIWGLIWSSSEYSLSSAWNRKQVNSSSSVGRFGGTKWYGFSIRCLGDEITTGCTDPEACNYDETATADDGSCEYAMDNYDCDGNCVLEVDCAGECGGSAVLDECGVCNGDGSSCATPGDINNDGNINVLDVVLMVNMVLANEYDEIADMNEDGSLNVLDVVILVNLILDGEPVCEGVEDVDGNCYETIQIGEQLWMTENLKVTHYNDGSEIPTGLSSATYGEWANTTEGAYAVYDDNPSYADIYGNLYNWYVIDDDRGVCPEGWHVPSDDEWTDLITYLDVDADPEAIGSQSDIAGGMLKDTGTIEGGDGLWYEPNEGATNESGFTALPAGYRNYDNGNYYDMGNYGCFWSSSESNSNYAWYRLLYYSYSSVYRYNYYGKQGGFSIRCLGD